VIAAWHRKDNRTGAVIVTSRHHVAQQLARELALSMREADLHLVSAVETGKPIKLEHATYFFGEPE
jgi:Mrp family chromosome partitioning ATPase